MIDEATPAARGTVRRPRLFLFTQVCALLLAMYVGWHSYQMVDADRLDIDRALLWMGAALVMLAYFAWDGVPPRLVTPRSAVRYVRAHPVELTLLVVIVAVGIFVRLFRFGTLPPSGYLYFEEHINGGIGWMILHGDRPYAFPLERYSSALGQWLIGPSTIGLRLPMMVAGMVAIVPFYLLMREIVDRPAALFAAAMYASLRVIADTSSYFQLAELVTITMVWTFLRGVRTGNAIWFIPMAVFGTLLLYEYETFKAVPLLGVPFVAFFGARALLWPLPTSARALRDRVRALAPRAIKPVVVTTVVVLIGIGPMVAQTHRGQHIFFSSLDRQRADRSARGTPGLFSPDAAEQLKWSAQVFTPFVKPEYAVLGSVPTRGAIDKITSILLWVSLGAGVAMFWRGARALFVLWFAGGVLVASLLLSDFGAWKIAGFLPAAVVLMGYFADDAMAIARGWGDRRALQMMAALAGIAAGVLVLNVRTLNANANDPLVVREWSNTPSQLYAICDHLRDRPEDNFAFVSQRVRPLWGFSRPPGDFEERLVAWSDWKFVCWGLQGEAIANIEEAWPLYRDVDGPINLTTIIGPDELQEATDAMRAIPGIGQPDRFTTAPGGLFSLLSYATTASQLNERRGLMFRRVAADGTSGAASVSAGPPFALGDPGGGGAFTLSGLVYAPEAMTGSLVPAGVSGATVAITVDGSVSYDAVSAPGLATAQQLLQGWHTVEVRGYAPAGERVGLRWQRSDGTTVEPGEDGFYAVEQLAAWRHTRTYEGATVAKAVRFDFHPHISNFDGLRIDATSVLPMGTKVSEDAWDARWTVETSGTYTIRVAAPRQTMRMTIDGKEVLSFAPPRPEATANIALAAGDHQVEIVFSAAPANVIGGLLTVQDSAGRPVAMQVRPF